MNKVKKTYRLDEKVIAKLAELAEKENDSVTSILESAVMAYGEKPDKQTDNEPYTAILDMLRGQLEVKDRQIERLEDALELAQRTAHAAQALQANSEGVVPQLQESGEHLTRWERLKKWLGV